MSDLQRIVELGNLFSAQKKRVDELKAQLDEANAAFRRTETEDLPELMRELGMSSISLTDGSSVAVVDDVDAAITEANRMAAHKWLSDNGFGGLIKTEVSVAFGRGEHDEAEEFVEQVTATGHEPMLVERVHPSTLKSFVKEQMEKGASIPFDLFSIRPYSKAKLTLPKAKKGKKS